MTGQDRTGQDMTGHDRTGQDMTGHDRTGHDRTGQDRIGHDRTRQDFNIPRIPQDSLIAADFGPLRHKVVWAVKIE